MKKIIIIVVLLVLARAHTLAQTPDTVTARNFNYWGGIVNDSLCISYENVVLRIEGIGYLGQLVHTIAKEYVPVEPVSVYGLAGIFVSLSDVLNLYGTGHQIPVEDTVFDNAFDSLILHTFETNNYSYPDTSKNYISRIKQVKISRGDAPVEYLYMPNARFLSYNLYDNDTSKYLPVREAYFDTPVIVRDTFYISTLNNHDIYGYLHNYECLANRSFYPILIEYRNINDCSEINKFVDLVYDTSRNEYFYQNGFEDGRGVYCYFPILTPPPVDTTSVDTTGHGGDTTAVEMVDGVGRYVSLTPNPAADRVQVLSSFGLTQVEAYNSEGRLVYADEAHGLSKTIDLAAWPRGIYLVRVITPMGSTTQKLVLR